jgi:hypothetical protein
MLRRWIIRLPFLLALVFVVGVWPASYFGLFCVVMRTPYHDREIGALQGLAELSKHSDHRGGFSRPQFVFFPSRTAKEEGLEPTIFGFRCGEDATDPGSLLIAVPFWLPTLVLLLLNWLVWRTTRANPGPGRAFPV